MTRPAEATPDTTWTDLQLLEEYNKFSPTKRRARFKTKELAIKSILQAKAMVDAAPPARAKKAAKRVAGLKRSPKNVRARMAGLVIQIVTQVNPYRDADDSTGRKESKAHAHYEKMRGGITVLDYLAKFTEQDQKNARQYLWNAIQDGHVKTVVPLAVAAE
jgi:hypothetical protein